MRATGISRSIDSLGRIVIPKEIRKNMQIREADLLEFYAGDEGEIILKKYSPMGEMEAFARQYAESLYQVSGFVSMITDRDKLIAVVGGCKNLVGEKISLSLQQRMEERKTLIAQVGTVEFTPVIDKPCEAAWQGMAPILSHGDVVGMVILLTKDEEKKMGEVERKLLLAAATFLGRQQELV